MTTHTPTALEIAERIGNMWLQIPLEPLQMGAPRFQFRTDDVAAIIQELIDKAVSDGARRMQFYAANHLEYGIVDDEVNTREFAKYNKENPHTGNLFAAIVQSDADAIRQLDATTIGRGE